MKYNYTYPIRYQDVDDTRHLRPYTLEMYLLDVAGACADELGFGIQKLFPRNLTWVLTSMSVEMQEMPTHCEEIRIETWIESNAHMLSVRDFRIYVGDQMIGKAKSVWAVLDLSKREIQNIFDDPMFEGSIDGEVLEMSRPPRMRLMTELTAEVVGQVLYSDLDYNGHCNSCQYLMKMMDARRFDISRPFRMDITYVREIMYGDTITVGYTEQADGVQYQIINPKGELSSACYMRNL